MKSSLKLPIRFSGDTALRTHEFQVLSRVLAEENLVSEIVIPCALNAAARRRMHVPTVAQSLAEPVESIRHFVGGLMAEDTDTPLSLIDAFIDFHHQGKIRHVLEHAGCCADPSFDIQPISCQEDPLIHDARTPRRVELGELTKLIDLCCATITDTSTSYGLKLSFAFDDDGLFHSAIRTHVASNTTTEFLECVAQWFTSLLTAGVNSFFCPFDDCLPGGISPVQANSLWSTAHRAAPGAALCFSRGARAFPALREKGALRRQDSAAADASLRSSLEAIQQLSKGTLARRWCVPLMPMQLQELAQMQEANLKRNENGPRFAAWLI